MKFIEKHVKTILNGNGSPLAKHVMPIRIQDAADWYFQEAEVYEASLRDQFRCVIAPSAVTYFEYEVPPLWKVKKPSGDGWCTQGTPHARGEYFACLIVQERLPAEFHGNSPAQGNILSQLLENVGSERPVGFLQTTFFFAGNAEDCMLACWAENYLDVDGKMMGGPVYNVHDSLLKRNGASPDEAYGSLIRAYGYPVYFALSLLTCPTVCASREAQSAKSLKEAKKVKSTPFSYWNLKTGALQASCDRSIRKALEQVRSEKDSCLFGKGANEAKASADLRNFKFAVGK